MSKITAKSFLRSRYLIAMVAGILLAASFPKIGIAGLAWIAPAVMMVAALGKRGWERFRIGYVAGLSHYLVSLYWLLLIPYRWHSIPLGPAAAWLALSGFMALFPAFWVWLLSIPERKGPLLVADESTTDYSNAPTEPWLSRAVWSISGAAAWVGIEMIVARIFSGFPWNLLGASQHQMLPLIQIASITGIYGISFILIWTSLSLLMAALTIIRQPTRRGVWMADIIFPATAVLVLFVFGFHQLKVVPSESHTLRVTFIQPSIPQTLIWDETKDDQRFADLIKLSQEALTNKTDLVIWPEAALPKPLRWWREMFEPISALARSNKVWMILGSDDMEPKPGSTDREDRYYYNSSFLINPDGDLVKSYRKRGLVIFGEYVPLVRWLPFMKYLTPIQGGFTPGKGPEPFQLSNLHINISILICFEDVFPHLARESVDEDTDLLVNLTNNGWFDESAAQWQHATSALFRAVENGRPLLRCSNNGLTCWVDSHGKIQQTFHDAHGTIYGAGFMTAEIPFGGEQSHVRTFYNAHGDLFGWSCVAWSALLLLQKLMFRKGNAAARG